jgi:hypothetical protein
MEMPGYEESLVISKPVRKATSGKVHSDWWGAGEKILAERGLKSPLEAEACSTKAEIKVVRSS